MNRERISFLLEELNLNDQDLENLTAPTLTELTNHALNVVGVSEVESRQIDSAFLDSTKPSFKQIGLGVGFGIWWLSQWGEQVGAASGGDIIGKILGRAEKWTDFVVSHWTDPIDSWADLNDLFVAITEHATTLPAGTIDLVADIVVAATTEGDFLENLEVVGALSDAADFLDGLTSLGLGLAVSFAVGAAMDEYVDWRTHAHREKLESLKQRALDLANLRLSLLQGSPVAVVATQLGQVADHHWGF